MVPCGEEPLERDENVRVFGVGREVEDLFIPVLAHGSASALLPVSEEAQDFSEKL